MTDSARDKWRRCAMPAMLPLFGARDVAPRRRRHPAAVLHGRYLALPPKKCGRGGRSGLAPMAFHVRKRGLAQVPDKP